MHICIHIAIIIHHTPRITLFALHIFGQDYVFWSYHFPDKKDLLILMSSHVRRYREGIGTVIDDDNVQTGYILYNRTVCLTKMTQIFWQRNHVPQFVIGWPLQGLIIIYYAIDYFDSIQAIAIRLQATHRQFPDIGQTRERNRENGQVKVAVYHGHTAFRNIMVRTRDNILCVCVCVWVEVSLHKLSAII